MKHEVFERELSYIKDKKYRENAVILIDGLPDYFFRVAASSTGKYHPAFASGEGGLVRHTKAAVRIAYELLGSMIGDIFNSKEKDLIILGLILHDGFKHGKEEERYTRFDHPLLAANYVRESKDKLSLTDEEIEFLYSIISSHMGPYNTSNYSDVVLPIPKNRYQKFVHQCDFLASRKFLDIKFDANNNIEG